MLESYRFGEILLLDFPYTDGAGASRRPALVLLDTGDNDVVVSRVTGQPARDQYDIEVNDLGSAGLRLQSIVRLHKLATLKKNDWSRDGWGAFPRSTKIVCDRR